MTTQKIGSGLASITARRDRLKTLANFLENTIYPKIPEVMHARGAGVTVSNLRFVQNGESLDSVHGTTDGGNGRTYDTRVTFNPAGHRCTCPDWVQRHRACKHVSALVVEAIGDLSAEVESLSGKIDAFTVRIAGLRADIAAANVATGLSISSTGSSSGV